MKVYGEEYETTHGTDYEALYARFVEDNTDAFWDATGGVKGKSFLDLCCGTGRLSLRALQEGAARVVAIDRSGLMAEQMKRALDARAEVSHVSTRMARLEIAALPHALMLDGIRDGEFDVVVCRQGANYWLFDDKMPGLIPHTVAKTMKKGGVFVFNSFSICPSYQPTVKMRTFEGKQYMEATWLDAKDGRTVHHVQALEGMPPHVSSFAYVAPHEWRDTMEAGGFKVEQSLLNGGRTVLYRCVKE